jgi:hypothetical protein
MTKTTRACRKQKPMVRTFRVYIEQVNQTYVDVVARCPSQAESKAYAKWRREDAHSRIMSVEERPNATAVETPRK